MVLPRRSGYQAPCRRPWRADECELVARARRTSQPRWPGYDQPDASSRPCGFGHEFRSLPDCSCSTRPILTSSTASWAPDDARSDVRCRRRRITSRKSRRNEISNNDDWFPSLRLVAVGLVDAEGRRFRFIYLLIYLFTYLLTYLLRVWSRCRRRWKTDSDRIADKGDFEQ